MGTDRSRDQNETPEKVRPFLTHAAGEYGLTEEDLTGFWEQWELMRKDYSAVEAMRRMPETKKDAILSFLAGCYLDRLTVERAVSAIEEHFYHE
jgi:hypothetical protein